VKKFKTMLSFRPIAVIAIIAIFCVGAVAYADFIRTSGSTGWGYGYGYDTSNNTYGYGYGYHQDDTSPTSRELYGFPGTDGDVTGVSVSASCTSAVISYTSDYLGQHKVSYDGPTSTAYSDFESGAQSTTLSNLTPSTMYTFTVDSRDAGGVVWSTSTDTFTTPGCESGRSGDNTNLNNSIVALIIPGQSKATIIDQVAGTVTVTMPYGTNITMLTPKISINGVRISPESDVTQNFSKPQLYVVYDSNGSEKDYIVTVVTESAPVSEEEDEEEIEFVSKFIFTRYLKFGSTGEEVRKLQEFLNNNNFPVSLRTLGSKGKETSFFGLRTKNAVKKFQLDRKIQVDGIVGPQTREELNK
jgi:hypothetical protein